MKRLFLFLSLTSICMFSTVRAQLSAPDLSSPIDSAVNRMVNVTLSWNPSTGGLVSHYLCEISSDSLFTNPVSLNTLGTSAQTNELLFGMKYFWRARAVSPSSAMSPWSTVRSFTTFVNQFTGLTPNGSEQPTNIVFKWDSLPGVISYKFEISNDSLFSSPNSQIVSHPVSQVTLDSLTFSTSYYWRIKTQHSKDSSGYSDFKSIRTLDSVLLLTPSNGAKDQYPSLKLICKNTPGVTHYRYELDVTSNFDPNSTDYESVNVDDSDFLKDDDIELQMERLKYGQKYYWRVKATNANGTSEWSQVRNFTTTDEVILKAPTDNTEISVDEELTWEELPGTELYELLIDDDINFGSPFVRIVQDEASVLPSNITNGTFYWTVRSTHANDVSGWSDTWSFDITGIGIDENFKDLGIRMYPNPSHDVLYLDFSELNDNVRVDIFDVSGSKVSSSMLTANFNTQQIDISKLESGIYMVSLNLDGTIVSQRLVKN